MANQSGVFLFFAVIVGIGLILFPEPATTGTGLAIIAAALII